MILKLKMKEASRENMATIKSHFFDDADKITAGYIIGLAVEMTNDVSDSEWENAIGSVLHENGTSGKSTSVSLRQEIFEKITEIKEKMQNIYGKSLYMSHVIDIILFVVANKINLSSSGLNNLTVMEWNLNARSGSPGYMIPASFIANEVLEKNPDIFVFTEFVESTGWTDLKTILEEKYYAFDSPYIPRENGICIGIRKECGIEYLGCESKSSIFAAHLNSPDFFEINVRINSKKLSVIGARIQIDYKAARYGTDEQKSDEQKQRFEQYTHLIDYIAKLDNGVIVLGDFNNSRILSKEKETDENKIERIYEGKISAEHNFQKLRAFAIRQTGGKLSLYTPDSELSSVGAFWDSAAKKARAPMPNKESRHKYDHILSNYSLERIEYNWSFLDFYDKTQFTANGMIKEGFPDHAILLATIKI